MKANPITPGLRLALAHFDVAYREVQRQIALIESGGDQDMSHVPVNSQLMELNESMAGVGHPSLYANETLMKMNSEGEQRLETAAGPSIKELDTLLEGIFTAKKDAIDEPRWSEMQQRILLAWAYSDFKVATLEGLTWGDAMNELDKLYVPRNSLRYYTLEERLDHAWRHKGMHKATTELMYQEYQEGKFSDEEIHGQLNALGVPTVYPTSKFVMHLNDGSTTAVLYMLSGTVDEPLVSTDNMQAVVAHPDIYADVKNATMHPLQPVDGAWVLQAINRGAIKAEERTLPLADRRVTVYRTNDVAKVVSFLK